MAADENTGPTTNNWADDIDELNRDATERHLQAIFCSRARKLVVKDRMTGKIFNVLFLCTGNSARSIMAEAYLNAAGKGRFVAHSAGSHPAGAVNLFTIELLRRNRIETIALRSKSWDEFAQQGAPRMDFVFTVCDQAAGEVCPVWPGQPMSAHWGIDDPAQAVGTDQEKRKAFFNAYNQLSTRINLFLNLPLNKLDRLALQEKLDEIGQVGRTETVS